MFMEETNEILKLKYLFFRTNRLAYFQSALYHFYARFTDKNPYPNP